MSSTGLLLALLTLTSLLGVPGARDRRDKVGSHPNHRHRVGKNRQCLWCIFFSSEYDWLTSGKKVKGACSKNKHLYLYKDALWYSDNLQILQCFCTNQMVLFKNRTVCAAEQSWAATHPECLEFHLKISLKILVQRDQSCGLGQTAPTTLRRMAGLGCQRGWYQSFCCCQLCLV